MHEMPTMPTRTDTIYRVMPVISGRPEPKIFKDFTTRADALTWGDELAADIASARFMYRIEEFTREREAYPEECTDAELIQAWQVYRYTDSLPRHHDEMGVTDPYLNYPGDGEFISDYFNAYATEYTRRDADRCIVEDTPRVDYPDPGAVYVVEHDEEW